MTLLILYACCIAVACMSIAAVVASFTGRAKRWGERVYVEPTWTGRDRR